MKARKPNKILSKQIWFQKDKKVFVKKSKTPKHNSSKKICYKQKKQEEKQKHN